MPVGEHHDHCKSLHACRHFSFSKQVIKQLPPIRPNLVSGEHQIECFTVLISEWFCSRHNPHDRTSLAWTMNSMTVSAPPILAVVLPLRPSAVRGLIVRGLYFADYELTKSYLNTFKFCAVSGLSGRCLLIVPIRWCEPGNRSVGGLSDWSVSS
jgi:hypothetical protein